MNQTVEMDWLKRWDLYGPQRIAVKDLGTNRVLTYRDLFQMSCALAHGLSDRFNVRMGDRVTILARNHWAFVPLFFACQRLGAALVPINFRLTNREVNHIVRDSAPALMIYHSEYADLVEGLDREIKPWRLDGAGGLCESLETCGGTAESVSMPGDEDTLAMILYTSGTTGAPKGAMINRRMLFWNSINTTMRLDLTQDDVHIGFLPFFHTGGWNVLLTPFLHRGAKTLLLDKFDPEVVLKTIAVERVTILFGVPTMLDMMARDPAFAKADLSSLRFAVVGGEPMPVSLIRTWQERGVKIRQGYGLTEFGPNVFSLNAEDAERKIGSIGFPNFYVDAKIVGADGGVLGGDQIGELALRGPMCMPGYWRHERATQETIRDGWLFTGDLVRRDPEGYYYVVGRKKDMYISGGENVYPAEIEQVLRLHPGVSEAAVIGVADEKWGEVGKAFVVPKESNGLTALQIVEHCRKNLAKYKVPRHVQLVSSLPKGDSGKILKRALNEGQRESH